MRSFEDIRDEMDYVADQLSYDCVSIDQEEYLMERMDRLNAELRERSHEDGEVG